MKYLKEYTAEGGSGDEEEGSEDSGSRRPWVLAGLLLERGLSLTGMDFVDGVFAVGGAVLASLQANRDMVEVASKNIRDMFGKDPWRYRRKSGISIKRSILSRLSI